MGPFAITGADLYPRPLTDQHLASRSFYQPACANNSDPFSDLGGEGGGCLRLQKDAIAGEVLDIASSPAPCPGPMELCRHQLTVHSVYPLPDTADRPVLLGDLSVYVEVNVIILFSVATYVH